MGQWVQTSHVQIIQINYSHTFNQHVFIILKNVHKIYRVSLKAMKFSDKLEIVFVVN